MGMLMGNKQGMRNVTSQVPPAFVSYGTSAESYNASPISPGIPLNSEVGDLLVLVVASYSGGTTKSMVTPSGWILVAGNITTYSYITVAIFTRIVDGTEGATVAITHDSTGYSWGAIISRFNGSITGTMGAVTSSFVTSGTKVWENPNASPKAGSIFVGAVYTSHTNPGTLTLSNYTLEHSEPWGGVQNYAFRMFRQTAIGTGNDGYIQYSSINSFEIFSGIIIY